MNKDMETSIEAKQRLIMETAMLIELNLRLCERHYFLHVGGSPECIIRDNEDYNLFWGIFDESSLRKYDIY